MVDHSDRLLIGINGFKNAGKSTIGQILVEDHEFIQWAFADKLKEAVAALFDITRRDVDDFKETDSITTKVEVMLHFAMGAEYVYNWREFLQRFGTEMGRGVFGENFWVDQILPLGQAFRYHQLENIVVTDARFNNELERIKRLGGYNFRVIRPGYDGEEHASEQVPDPELIDQIIHNDGTIDDLRGKVADALVNVYHVMV